MRPVLALYEVVFAPAKMFVLGFGVLDQQDQHSFRRFSNTELFTQVCRRRQPSIGFNANNLDLPGVISFLPASHRPGRSNHHNASLPVNNLHMLYRIHTRC